MSWGMMVVYTVICAAACSKAWRAAFHSFPCILLCVELVSQDQHNWIPPLWIPWIAWPLDGVGEQLNEGVQKCSIPIFRFQREFFATHFVRDPSMLVVEAVGVLDVICDNWFCMSKQVKKWAKLNWFSQKPPFCVNLHALSGFSCAFTLLPILLIFSNFSNWTGTLSKWALSAALETNLLLKITGTYWNRC